VGGHRERHLLVVKGHHSNPLLQTRLGEWLPEQNGLGHCQMLRGVSHRRDDRGRQVVYQRLAHPESTKSDPLKQSCRGRRLWSYCDRLWRNRTEGEDQKVSVVTTKKSDEVEASRRRYCSVVALLGLAGSMQVRMAARDPRSAVVDLSAKQTPCLLHVGREGREATTLLGTKRACVMITRVLYVCEPHIRSKHAITDHGRHISDLDKTTVMVATQEEREGLGAKIVSGTNLRPHSR